MAGVGEASAIVELISTAASLSKAVIDIASKYKVARRQIESFGQEVGILGNILDQLRCLYSKDDLGSNGSVVSVTVDILDQCSGLFAQLETYRDTLYSRTGSVRNFTFLGKTKWVFEEKELEYLRTRVESIKLNMSNVGATVENYAEQARILLIQSEECAKRLQTLKNDVVKATSTDADPLINRMSTRVIDTAASVRSTTDSILSLYCRESIYETPSESQGEVLGTGSMQVDQVTVSGIIEDHIRKSAVIDEDGPDSPFILPSTFKHFLDSSTANNDEAIEDLKVEHFNHLAAVELGVATDSNEVSSDQHQYDSERIVSGFFLRNTCGVTLKGSYFLVLSSAVQYYEKDKDWRHYELCIALAHRERYLQLDERPMMILDSLVRQLPLHDAFKLRRLVVPVLWEHVNYMLNAIAYTYPINRQHCYHEVLAAMLQAVDESYLASSYELCLKSLIFPSTSRLNMDQKPLALYQVWAQEGGMPFFIIRLKDVART